MKKIFFVAISVLILLSSIASAQLANVKPTVTAEFNENVIPEYFFFKRVTPTPQLEVNATPLFPTTVPQTRFSFVPSKGLPNGDWQFILQARDLVGNSKKYYYDFSVFVENTRILMTYPNSIGYSKYTPFNVSIFTSKPAMCKYTGIPIYNFDDIKLKWFDVTGNQSGLVFDHMIRTFDVKPDFPQDFFVVCKDDLNRETYKQFTLHTDPTPPRLSQVIFDPGPVAEYPPEPGPLYSTLRVTASEPVICRYTTNANYTFEDMDKFPGYKETDEDAFDTVNEVKITFPDDTVKDTFTYYVQCIDRAYHKSEKVKKDVLVDLTLGLSIRINSPPRFSRNTSVLLNISTNKRAYCMYSGTSPDPTAFTDPNAAFDSNKDNLLRDHAKDLGARSSGNHTINILCIVPEGVGYEYQEGQRSYTYTIDTNPPPAPEVVATSPVCGSTLSASFLATDAESGINEYRWIVGGGGEIYNNGTTTTTNISVSEYADGTSFNLSDGVQYSFSVSAVDNAGNEGPIGSSNTIEFDSTGTKCDSAPPTIKLIRSFSGDSVTVECEDDKSGCDPTYSWYNSAYQEPCEPTQYFFPPVVIPLFRTTIVCYNITDMAGNRAIGSQIVDVNATVPEGEPACPGGIDSDGDGYGERCPFGPDCNDQDKNLTVGCANGCISDLDGDGFGLGCTAGNDCHGQDPNLTTDCPNGCLSDNDGDQYGLGCNNGPDCKGDDSTLTTQCPNGCLDDNDGDSYGIFCPAGFDCHGEDPNKLVTCENSCLQDTDGDGFGIKCTDGLDCDGADPDLTTGCANGCVFDEDGDGFGLGCNDGNDCNGLNVRMTTGCPNNCQVDNDGDNYGWGCDYGADCDDTDPQTNMDCSATTNCVYDHDADGFGLGCAQGPDCDDFDSLISNSECEANCTFDEDCNGLPDDWQLQYWNNTVCEDIQICGPDADPDEDGFSNIEEYRRGSDPLVKEEVALPPEPEPEVEDADEDGMLDACEIAYGLNPQDPFDADSDPDTDTLTNKFECSYTSGACSSTWLNPKNEDTDFDGFPDNEEIDEGFDPCDPESHPSGSPIGLILLIIGLIAVICSVGYLIYKRYYIPLISPPQSPKPAAPAAKARSGAAPKKPAPRHLAQAPAHATHHVIHHHVKAKPKGPLMSREKYLEEQRKKMEEREKLFSKFGAKKEHPKDVMRKIAERPAEHVHVARTLALKKQTGKGAEKRKEAPSKEKEKKVPDHVDRLAKIIGPDAFDKISDLTKKEADYVGKLATIMKKRDVPLEEHYVDKLAKVTKEVEKKKEIKPKEVEKAFKKTDIDKLDSFLDSRKQVSTFLKEYAKEEVKEEKEKKAESDSFQALDSLGFGKKADFDTLEDLSKHKREDLVSDLQDLSTKKAKETALSKMTQLSGAESKEDILKTFSRISKEKHVDKDVFSILLDYLMKSGKITKRDVSEILFKLEEDGILDKKDVSDVFFSLGVKK